MDEKNKRNWNYASNNDLKNEIERITSLYEEEKSKISESYDLMKKYAEEYDELKKILNKREGKTK